MRKLGSGSEYVYFAMTEELARQIRSGVLRPGERIASENALAQIYGISRRSVREGLACLAREGLVVAHAGKGSFVAERPEISKEAGVVALVVPDVDDAFISEVCKGVQTALAARGMRMVIQSSGRNFSGERAAIDYWLGRGVAGVILFPVSSGRGIENVFRLCSFKVPFVLIDRYFRDLETDCVVVDNYQGGMDAVAHLIDSGCRRIAHIQGTGVTANVDRFEGYRDGLTAAGMVYDQSLVRRLPPGFQAADERFEPDVSWGREAMRSLLESGAAPDALFAGNDYIALGALRTMREAGVRVGDDIAVVGFDDLKFVSLLDTPLTTVRQPKQRIGEEAVALLAGRIGGQRGAAPERVVLPTELIVRESSRR